MIDTDVKVIDDFHGANFFLDNFFPAPTMYEGVVYPTSEHAFQAAKSTDPTMRAEFAKMVSPGMAKRYGNAIQLRPDWEDVKVQVMRDVLADKFARHPFIAKALLATGDAELIEGNTWDDKFWGVCDGEGENYLGRLLMELRTAMRGGA
jgi:ribA/ribD-fused uncharacterized protein